MWKELKSKLSGQYSSIPFDSHVFQAYTNLQQGLDELLECIYTVQASSYKESTTLQAYL